MTTAFHIPQSSTEEVLLEVDHIINLRTDLAYQDKCTAKDLYVDYGNIVHVLEIGSKVFIDDGLISLSVIEKG